MEDFEQNLIFCSANADQLAHSICVCEWSSNKGGKMASRHQGNVWWRFGGVLFIGSSSSDAYGLLLQGLQHGESYFLSRQKALADLHQMKSVHKLSEVQLQPEPQLKFIVEAGQQCGQESSDDKLSPTCVSSLLEMKIDGVVAGLLQTICCSGDGDA